MVKEGVDHHDWKKSHSSFNFWFINDCDVFHFWWYRYSDFLWHVFATHHFYLWHTIFYVVRLRYQKLEGNKANNRRFAYSPFLSSNVRTNYNVNFRLQNRHMVLGGNWFVRCILIHSCTNSSLPILVYRRINEK